MNWFEKLWCFVVSSNDEPFLQEIKTQKEDAFQEGRNDKVAQLQRVLHIEGRHW